MGAPLKKYFLSILAMALVLGLVAAKPFSSGEPSEQDVLVVGLQSGYPPFEYMDTQGKIVGFDVDVAGLIAEKLEKVLVIKDMDFEGEILSLKQGKIDLIVSGMNITPSRLKEILMVPYHGEAATSLTLMFWNDIPAGVHSLEDIAGLSNPTVSVESGAIPEAYMTRHKNIEAKSFQGALAPLMDVKYGKSIANLVEPDVAEYLKTQHSEIKLLSVPLPKDEAVLGFGIGVKKESQELFNQVQQVIHELRASGELKLLEDRWFKGVE